MAVLDRRVFTHPRMIPRPAGVWSPVDADGSTRDELTEWWAWNRKDTHVNLWPFRSARPTEPDPPDDDHDADCAWRGELHTGPCDGLPTGDGADTTAWRRARTPTPYELADTEPRLPAPRRKDALMTDNLEDPGPGPDPFATTAPGDPTAWNPVTDSGSHRLSADEHGQVSQPLTPPAYANEHRPDCRHCMGTGKELTTNDLLRASLEPLGTDEREHDRFVAEFYRRLLGAAPHLRFIFPADLDDPGAAPDGKGKAQRDRLLRAVLALAASYDPDSDEAMQALDTHLGAFGRQHAAFKFADGMVRPPTLEEYVAVKDVLFGLLREASGEQWRPEFGAAWSEAYDYAVRQMGHAAWLFLRDRRGEVFPRTVRG